MSQLSDLVAADSVRVIESTGFDAKNRRNNRQLASVEDARMVTEIAELPTTWTDSPIMDWMEWPTLSVVFLRNRTVIAEFGLLCDCRWTRISADGGDHEIANSDGVISWLEARGIDVV